MSDRTAIKPLVLDEQTTQRVRELRADGLSPKEIARSLAIKPAIVSDLVRRLAAERNAANPDADYFECLLNAGWSTGLKITEHPEWHEPSTRTPPSRRFLPLWRASYCSRQGPPWRSSRRFTSIVSRCPALRTTERCSFGR